MIKRHLQSNRHMTEICIWLEKLLEWVDRCGSPPIPYIGKAPSGYRNLPAPHLEISYVLDKGYRDVTIGKRVVSIPPFHVALHNVHQGNFTPTMQQSASWCVFLDVGGEKAFTDLDHGPLSCCAPLPLNKEVIAAYERLGGLCVRNGADSLYNAPGASYDPAIARSVNPAAVMRTKAALLGLLALLLDVLGAGDESLPHPLPVQRAIEFISLHYRDPNIRLPDVSRAAGLSPDHFGRLFRQHTGETPMHYLKRTRINQARYLLERTDLLVEEIAFDIGFSDPFHFSRIFHALNGKSPRAWRNRQA